MTKAGRIGNAITYKTAKNKLIAFAGREELRFEQIDYKLLNSFTNSMLAEEMAMNAPIHRKFPLSFDLVLHDTVKCLVKFRSVCKFGFPFAGNEIESPR